MYGDAINTNFQGNKMPEKNVSYDRFSMIMLNSVIRVNKRLNTFGRV